MKLGYLDPKDYENWRMKRVPCSERVIKINLGKINFIMKTVRRNCLNGNLNPSWTGYKSWGKGRKIDLTQKMGTYLTELTYSIIFL
jgi:hypothetical protein